MSAVEVVRGEVVESRHQVHVAVSKDGSAMPGVGDPARLTYYRSAAKPIQALPLVEEGIADRFGLTAQEIALCCASHEGEVEHVAGARSILTKVGLDESYLACGAHLPFAQGAAHGLLAAGGSAERIHNNCSGKHAGMLALAVGMGWDPERYHVADHPVQQRMRQEIERWTGLDAAAIPTAIDGCGVVCFAVTLDHMAASMARFGRSAHEGGPASRIVDAMTAHPFMVGGTGRACTDVMERAAGQAFVKLGAEGVYAGGIPDRGIGFAIKVEDGGRRAVEVALVRVLRGLGVFDADDVEALRRHANPGVLNTRGELVGELRADFRLPEASA